MLVFREYLLQRGGSIIVEVWPALTHATQRGRIELPLPEFVVQADVVSPLRCVVGGRVAGGTLTGPEKLLAPRHGRGIAIPKLSERRRCLQRAEIGHEGGRVAVAEGLPLHRRPHRLANLIFKLPRAAIPGPGRGLSDPQ